MHLGVGHDLYDFLFFFFSKIEEKKFEKKKKKKKTFYSFESEYLVFRSVGFVCDLKLSFRRKWNIPSVVAAFCVSLLPVQEFRWSSFHMLMLYSLELYPVFICF